MTKLNDLPKHKAGLFLTHNEHKGYYQNISDFILERNLKKTFSSEEDYEKAIADDSIWVLQWYPDTPVGFHIVSGSTLESVLRRHYG